MRHSTAYYPGLRVMVVVVVVEGGGVGMKGAQEGDGEFDKGNEMEKQIGRLRRGVKGCVCVNTV